MGIINPVMGIIFLLRSSGEERPAVVDLNALLTTVDTSMTSIDSSIICLIAYPIANKLLAKPYLKISP